MFCNKCGKELPDNAQFCSGCGNQVGTAPVAAAAPAPVPVIFKRLVGQVANFFTKKNPVGVVVNSAKDNSFSGILLAIFGIIAMALGAMVNVNQGMLAFAKYQYKLYDMKWTSKIAKQIAKGFPSGTSFLLSALGAAVAFFAAAAVLYVIANYIAKKPLTFSGAINVVAYSSIPVICVSILNMLLGLIWINLAPIAMFFAISVTALLMLTAFNKVVDSDKSFTYDLIVVAVVGLVAIIFTSIALNAINNVKGAEGCISYLFTYWIKIK